MPWYVIASKMEITSIIFVSTLMSIWSILNGHQLNDSVRLGANKKTQNRYVSGLKLQVWHLIFAEYTFL